MSNVQVQLGGQSVQVQVQSSGFARANAAVTLAAASAAAAEADATAAAASAVSTAADAIATAADRVQTGLDADATAADRVQTGLDVVATGADAVSTAADALATAADAVQTGLDRVATAADAMATAADRVQTGLDAVATAADRVQTGLDRTAAATSASDAAATLAAAALKANNLSDLASPSTARTNLGVAIGANVQAYSANLDEYAAVNPTAAGLALLDDADASAQRTTLGAAASFDFDTLAAVQAATIPATVETIHIAGRTAVGDRGDGYYRQVASEPAHQGKVQSADGQWWELIPDCAGGVRAHQLGATAGTTVNGTLATTNATAIITGLRYYKKVFLDRVETAGDFYYCDSITVASNETLWGDDMGTEEDNTKLGTVILGVANRAAHVPVVGNLTPRPATDADRDQNLSIYGFTVDGNKANNATGGEWSHGVQLYAVNGAYVNMRSVNTLGDGLVISYGYSAALGKSSPYCVNIHGRMVSEDASRQGVAVICAENVNLVCNAYRAALFGFDIENDATGEPLNNIRAVLFVKDCGNGTVSSGGIGCYGVTGENAKDIVLDFQIVDCTGTGILYRQAVNAIFRGTIRGNGYSNILQCGAEGAGDPSDVRFDLDIYSTNSIGRVWDNGGRFNGSVRLHSQVGSTFQLRDIAGGELDIQWPLGTVSDAGLLLNETSNMTIHGKIAGCRDEGIWFLNSSDNNRIYADLSGNNTATFQTDIDENSGNNNRFFNQKNSVTAVLSGAGSVLEYESLRTTVAGLPAASARGANTAGNYVVTDAAAPTFGATVAGGGAVVTPVYSDGTNWKVG